MNIVYFCQKKVLG